MSRFDDFVERLEATLRSEEGREAPVEYLQGMTPVERAEFWPRRGVRPED